MGNKIRVTQIKILNNSESEVNQWLADHEDYSIIDIKTTSVKRTMHDGWHQEDITKILIIYSVWVDGR